MKNFSATIRTLRLNPAYSAIAIVTLALGIACSAAVFSLLDAIYFRPIPIRAPEELVQINLESPKSTFGALSYSEYRQLAERASAFQDVVAIGRRGVTFRQNDESTAMIIHFVSGNYFEALGLPIYLGRGLNPSDDAVDASTPAVVINYQVWAEQLGRRRDVINSTIQLNDAVFTVVGVTPPGFLGLSRLQRTHVWVTAGQAHFVRPGLQQEIASPFNRWFEIVARTKPGSQPILATQLNTVLANWRADNAEQYNAATLTAKDYLQEDRADRAQGVVFLGLVALVLVIACANVANLMLARGEARRREIAVRTALGASRVRLARDAMREAFVLSLAATIVGLILVYWLVDLFPLLMPSGMGGLVIDVRIDARVLAFAAFISLLTFFLIGAIPAWGAARVDVVSTIKDESQASGTRRFATRDFLVITQVALSVMVVVAAAMLMRSLLYGRNIDPGFDTRKNVASFYIVPSLNGYDNAATYRFFEQARTNVAAIAGVRRASYAIRLPAQNNESGWAQDFTIPGKQPPPGEQFFRIKYTMVGPNYFSTMGTRLILGRGIDESDLPNNHPVAIVNQTMARRFWGDESPIGKTITMGRRTPVVREIIGVAQDNKIAGLYEDSQMYVYVPFAQDQQGFGLLLVETDGDAAGVSPIVRNKVREIDSRLKILDQRTFASYMNLVLFDERRDAIVAMTLSGLSLFLSVVGVYGVVSLVTRRRIREIGIRMALGASRAKVVRMVVGRVWLVALAGILAGAAGSVAAARSLQSRLHGVPVFDAPSIALAGMVLFFAATLAAVLPSWRASKVNPTQALRHE